jgi:uncharacterized protein YaaN involved in tellurite resistance
MQNFSESEQQMIDDFSKQIDVKDANLVFSYGAAAQQNISQFSDAALKNVRTKDLDEVGDMISNLVVELKSFNTDDEEKGGLFGLFKKKARSLEVMKAQYDKTEINVNKITEGLEQHQIQLLKDIAMLDKLYDQNLVLTNGAPVRRGVGMTEMLALNIANNFTTANQRGVAQAKAVLFFILVTTIALVQLRLTRSKEVQQ